MKIGDKVYYDFEECTIKRIENENVYEVSDGYFSTSGNLTDSCFPSNSKTKMISDRFLSSYQAVYGEGKGMNLNFPDIRRNYVRIWVQCLSLEGDKNSQDGSLDAMEIFTCSLLDEIKDLKKKTVYGVRLFRG